MLYVTTPAFKQSVSIPDSATDSDVVMALEAASRAVEEITQRRFWKDSSPATRVFTAATRCHVRIDDIAQIDTVTSAGTTITDYVARPANAVADGKPYTSLKSSTGIFSTADDAIEVTGLFGWPDVPGQVPQMVTILASKMLKRTREAPFGIVTAGSLEGIAVQLARTDPDMRLLIEPLMRFSMLVA